MRQRRLLRGAAASSVATVIAAVSHTLGGGSAPHPLLVLALSVFLTPVAALLSGRTLDVRRIAGTVLLSQGVFHVLFHLLGATLGSAPTGRGHEHHALTLGPALPSAAPDAPMLAAHVIAAVLTTALLWRGEQLLRTIARWVHATLRPRMPRPPERPAAAPLVSIADRLVVTVLRIGDVARRGPPATSCG